MTRIAIPVARRLLAFAVALVALGSAAGLHAPSVKPQVAPGAAYLVQARSADEAAATVARSGGKVSRRLPVIDGVAAVLDSAALGRLLADGQVTLHPDPVVRATGDLAPPEPDTASGSGETDTAGFLLYPAAATGARLLHEKSTPTTQTTCNSNGVSASGAPQQLPIQGWGVTVAVIDSGFMKMQNSATWQAAADGTLFASNAEGRCIVYRDFLPRSAIYDNDGVNRVNSTDQNGHGTHVISTIADNRATQMAAGATASPVGIAPKVNLVIARVLDREGGGTYSRVIDAIQWILDNRTKYNIRVLNLSLYTPVGGPYWYDPLNQAVMRAWQAGITIVAAAGNSGPAAATITVPGNNPYIISVGAIKSGRYTQSGDDELAFYSSRGPTESAFVKPDVLVPASRTIAPMPDSSALAREIPQARIQEIADVDYGIGSPLKTHTYYRLSGTSMAAAEVSGLVALMLQADPALTNNQVKYRLLATARPAIDQSTGQPAYSPWEQGTGLVDAQQAVLTSTTKLANLGMDLGLDLASPIDGTHYWGYTQWYSPSGEFQLIDPQTGQPLAVWAGAGRVWAGAGRVWAGAGRVWAGAGRVWAGAGRVWAGGISTWASQDSLWAGAGRVWAGTTPNASVNTADHVELVIDDSNFRIMVPLIRH
jgi:subtilisin family serine protease